jgi:hypothetical protein
MAVPFQLGQLIITPLAAEEIADDAITCALRDHLSCNWTNLPDEDQLTNLAGLRLGGRIFSKHFFGKIEFWIITEADRSATTICLPQDY